MLKFSPESTLEGSLKKDKFVMIKGLSGSGKSCTTNYVLYKNIRVMFPVVIKTRMEPPERIFSSSENFMKFILSRILVSVQAQSKLDTELRKQAQNLMAAKVSYLEGRKGGVSGKIKAALSFLPGIVSVKSEVGADIQEYTERALEEERYNTDRVECINELGDTIETHKLKMVIFIDDTDKFLKFGNIDYSNMVAKFFGEMVYALKEIRYPVVVAASEHYSKNNLFSDASDRVFDDIIKMPKINREGIIKIMGKRIKAIDEKRSHKDVFNEESVDIIFNYYNRTHDLREALRLCKESITKAVDDNLDIVPASIVANCLMEKIR